MPKLKTKGFKQLKQQAVSACFHGRNTFSFVDRPQMKEDAWYT